LIENNYLILSSTKIFLFKYKMRRLGFEVVRDNSLLSTPNSPLT
jgi:hypothetical protein